MKGFTLIELLVVVLIIGILAAIALPQYQKAVEKSRAAEAIQNIQVIQKNMELFLSSTGGFPQGAVDWAELENMGAGSLQGGEWDGNQYITKDFSYGLFCFPQYCSMEIARRKSNSYTLVAIFGEGSYGPVEARPDVWTLGCVTQLNDSGRSICKSLQSQGFGYYDDEL